MVVVGLTAFDLFVGFWLVVVVGNGAVGCDVDDEYAVDDPGLCVGLLVMVIVDVFDLLYLLDQR